ncbi:MAG: hypothetical protein NTZ35_06575 [Ignavibacteriales bacterium]|nr:hypothetical protein [Ignavibacteriales bacterium]
MMKIVLHIFPSLLLLLLVSCGSSRNEFKGSDSGGTRYRALAAQEYGQAVEFLFNDAQTAVVCLKKSKPTAKDPQQQVSFFVFDLSIDSVIFEDEIPNGSVGWRDNFTVFVNTVPGNEKSDEASAGQKSGYLFDLRSRKTRSLDAATIQ